LLKKDNDLWEKNFLRAVKIGDFILNSGNTMEVYRK
jgi:hypothetical protein